MSALGFALEFGEGHGHIGTLAPLIGQMAARGHRVTLNAAQPRFVRPVAERLGVPLHTLPYWPRQARKADTPFRTVADFLWRMGYDQPDLLRPQFIAWRARLQALPPDLLVANYAPTALLAAQALGIPVLTQGVGFDTPPACHPLASLPPQPGTAAEREATEAAVLTGINTLLAAEGHTPLPTLGSLFGPRAALCCTVPALDHYDAAGARHYCGPQLGVQTGTRFDWPAGRGPRCFIYQPPTSRHLPALLAALDTLGWPTVAYLRGQNPNVALPPNIVISEQPLAIEQVLNEAGLIISHGGSLCLAALVAGIPLLPLPTNQEQNIIHQRIAALGLLPSPPDGQPQRLTKRLNLLVHDPDLKQRRQAFAAAHVDYRDTARNTERMANYLEEILTTRMPA